MHEQTIVFWKVRRMDPSGFDACVQGTSFHHSTPFRVLLHMDVNQYVHTNRILHRK